MLVTSMRRMRNNNLEIRLRARKNGDRHVAIARKHLSVKQDKVSHVSYSFTAIYCQLGSLNNCEVIAFLFANVRQQFIRRSLICFRYPIKSE